MLLLVFSRFMLLVPVGVPVDFFEGSFLSSDSSVAKISAFYYAFTRGLLLLELSASWWDGVSLWRAAEEKEFIILS